MTLSQINIYSTSKTAWNAMYEAISQAKKSVYWELYIFVDDEAGARFFDLLSKKATEGVDVKLIIDALGSFSVSRGRIESLRANGVDVRVFQERKHRYRGIWRAMISRTHRKVLVVDETIGFIGGVNIQKNMSDWLDMQLRIEGKAVRSLLRTFAKMYRICGGPKEQVKHLLRKTERDPWDKKDVQFVYDDAHDKKSNARELYTDALGNAKKRVILFTPYYFPDRKFLQALWAARKRGVRVDLLMPWRTDVRIATFAAYALMSLMHTLGVNVHVVDRMMHGKGVLVDDEWAMVGSSNIDPTSFYDNYEANAVVRDKKAVKELRGTLNNWMEESRRLLPEEWAKRGWLMRVQEFIAYWLYRLWHRQY